MELTTATMADTASVSSSAAIASGWVTARPEGAPAAAERVGEEGGDRQEDQQRQIRDGEGRAAGAAGEPTRRGQGGRWRRRGVTMPQAAPRPVVGGVRGRGRLTARETQVGDRCAHEPDRRPSDPLTAEVETPSDCSTLATMPVSGSKNFVFTDVQPPRLSMVKRVFGLGKLNFAATEGSTGR